VTWFAYAVGLKETEEERRKYIRKRTTGIHTELILEKEVHQEKNYRYPYRAYPREGSTSGKKLQVSIQSLS
jgi:hypothetical protein